MDKILSCENDLTIETMLVVAMALGQQLQVRFVPMTQHPARHEKAGPAVKGKKAKASPAKPSHKRTKIKREYVLLHSFDGKKPRRINIAVGDDGVNPPNWSWGLNLTKDQEHYQAQNRTV